MRIAICVKQVPDTNEIEIDKTTKRLVREGVPSILNPFDAFALETALRLRETYGGRITALTMGPPQAKAVLKCCTALGADAAFHLNDLHFAGSDTYATSYILAEAIKHIEQLDGAFDLIICGKQAVDGDTAQVGPAMAEHLGIAQITGVADVPELCGDQIMALSEKEDRCDRIRTRLPALISVGKTPYELRYASLGGIKRSNRFEYISLTAEDLKGLDKTRIGLNGSPTVTKKTFTPPSSPEATMITGRTPTEQADVLIRLLRKANMITGGA